MPASKAKPTIHPIAQDLRLSNNDHKTQALLLMSEFSVGQVDSLFIVDPVILQLVMK